MSTINSRNDQIIEHFFTTNNIGKIFSWSEVAEIHRTRNGIYQKNGKLISLLTDFGKINPAYPDFHGANKETIFYTGAGKHGNQKLDVWNKAMHEAIKTRIAVPLFCKLDVNKWRFLGFWQVCDAEYVFEPQNQRNVWSFVLKKVDLQEF